jgi:hypothetical protein
VSTGVKRQQAAKIIRRLALGPVRALDLVAEIDGKLDTVYDWLKALRAQRICYIAEWSRVPDCKSFVPMYRLGFETDAVRPRASAGAKRQAAYKARRQTKKEAAVLFTKTATFAVQPSIFSAPIQLTVKTGR